MLKHYPKIRAVAREDTMEEEPVGVFHRFELEYHPLVPDMGTYGACDCTLVLSDFRPAPGSRPLTRIREFVVDFVGADGRRYEDYCLHVGYNLTIKSDDRLTAKIPARLGAFECMEVRTQPDLPMAFWRTLPE